jgi:RimJ/RimL family protein N-acetyltransferase
VDLSSLYGLRLRTDRLELRWPTVDEIVELAHLAEGGVHDPAEMPFLVEWTDRIGTPGFIDEFVSYHLGLRERWRDDDWSLQLGVWAADELVGTQGIDGRGFGREQEHVVETGSWLAQRFHGQGYGTEMRAAVLELAFHGLGATVATSPVFETNVASRHVSEKLGYIEDGEAWPTVRGAPVHELIMKLTRDRWIDRERISVRISGLEACIPLFGLKGPPAPPAPSC